MAASLNCLQAYTLWQRANQADQGAAGEETIAAVLAPLKHQGWQIEYNICDRSVGDVDIFLLSSKGRACTIDVKSHRGKVGWNGKQLYRCYQSQPSQHPFEKDFLKQAKRQAVAIQKRRGLSFVTPIVAFSSARVEVGSKPIAGVYVVDKQDLLRCLRSLG